MRTAIISIMLLLSCVCVAQFQFEDGPWYAARVRDIAVGYTNGVSVIYAVNMSGGCLTTRTLVKSTDGGETWQHIQSIENPISVATRRDNPDIVFVSTSDVGILKSTNGGSSWAVVYPGFVARRIAIARSNPNFVFAGAYFPYSYPPYLDHSLHVSNDGGNTWGPDFSFEFRTSVTSIMFHPTQPIFYVSGVSLGAGAQHKGIWKNYVRVTEGLPNEQIATVAMQEDNPAVLYAGTISPYGEQEPGEFRNNVYESQPPQIYKSTDAGNTWTTRGTFYASGIAIDPNNSLNILVSSDQGMMRSTDAGLSWSESVAGLYDRNILSLAADNSRGGAVFAGAFHSLYRTTNAGASWTEQTKGIERPPVTGITVQHGRVIACGGRSKPQGLYDVWIGTLHRSNTPGDPWVTTFPNSGFDTDIYYWNDIKAHPMSAQTIFVGGSYDPDVFSGYNATVFRSTDNGTSWQPALLYQEQREITSIDFDASNENVIFAAGYRPAAPPSDGFVARSTDKGANWSVLNPAMAEIQQIVVDPTTTGSNRVIYVAGSSIRKSKDDGATWYDANAGIGEARTLAIDPVHPNILYGGNANGVYKTVDGGERWEEINNGVTYRNVTSILVHPNTPDIIYVSSVEGDLFDPVRAHVYKTTNGGQQWYEVSGSGGLPEHAYVYKLRFDDASANTVYVATDSGVYGIPHIWTGQLLANAMWRSGQTYLVDGTLTVASGKTLAIEPGVTAKFFPSAQLVADGVLDAVGDASARIVFTSHDQTELSWKGIRLNGARTRSTIGYADITDATTGIALSQNTEASVTNCSITGAKVGVYLFDSPGPLPLLRTVVRHNNIRQSRIVGLSVDKEVSNVIIQDNTFQGNFNDDVGMQFISASPLEVVRNSVREFGKHGIQCTNASPSFVDGAENGGRSCFVNNRIGVYGEASANFILGMVDQYNAPGYNTIAYNEESEIDLVKECVVYSQFNYHFRRNFNIDESSRLIYDPDLDEDPNRCLDGGNRPVAFGNEPKERNDPSAVLFGLFQNPLVNQAIRLRLQRQHLAAIAILKGLISANPTDIELQRWALQELIANYQLTPTPSGSNLLSGYLRELLQQQANPEISRAIRDVLSSALWHQRDFCGNPGCAGHQHSKIPEYNE